MDCRLQVEVQKYLSVRLMHKVCYPSIAKEGRKFFLSVWPKRYPLHLQDNDASDLQKKTIVGLRSMSQCFVDPIKAEADLQLLDQSKDANIWRILTTLLDPNTSSLQSRSLRVRNYLELIIYALGSDIRFHELI